MERLLKGRRGHLLYWCFSLFRRQITPRIVRKEEFGSTMIGFHTYVLADFLPIPVSFWESDRGRLPLNLLPIKKSVCEVAAPLVYRNPLTHSQQGWRKLVQLHRLKSRIWARKRCNRSLFAERDRDRDGRVSSYNNYL